MKNKYTWTPKIAKARNKLAIHRNKLNMTHLREKGYLKISLNVNTSTYKIHVAL